MPSENTGDPQVVAQLEGIERKISALLAIAVDDHLRASPDLANPRPRSIDKLLLDAGLRQTEIASTLGKSPQAVSQVLASEKKKKAPTPKKTEPVDESD